MIQPREAKSYPDKPNGALNFTASAVVFRYGEPQKVIPSFTEQSSGIVGYQRPCLYAFGGPQLTDASVLRITCVPPDNPDASLNAVFGFGKPPQHEWPKLIETSDVKPVVFQRDPDKKCMLRGQHSFDRQGPMNPRGSGYRLWLQLATTFSTFTVKVICLEWCSFLELSDIL